MSKFLLAIVITLFSSLALGLSVRPPLKNIEVYGQVTLNGKAAVDVPVEFRTGSCFAELNGKTKTNKNGFYYIKLTEFFHAGGGLHVIVPAVKTVALYAPHCAYESVEVEYKSNQRVRYNIALKKAQPISQDQRQCLAKGGQWGPLTKTKIGCNFRYTDYTQMCSDGSQCQAKTCLPAWSGDSGYCPMDTYQIMNSRAIWQKGKAIEKKTD